VWVNVNFLAAGALRQYYGRAPGPFAETARVLGLQIEQTVVATVAREYARTGFLWESYRDHDGGGRGTHPFTGWTALVALLATGRYPF
jgi:mannosyl-oligosaccharide glucosidase